MGLSVRGVVALGEDPTPIAPRSRRSQPCVRLRLLGKTASRRDPSTVERAEGYYREALALAGELGMRPLVAHCHLGLGKLYRRTGGREQAEEHLATATTMYREMDIPFWLDHGAEMRGGPSPPCLAPRSSNKVPSLAAGIRQPAAR